MFPFLSEQSPSIPNGRVQPFGASSAARRLPANGEADSCLQQVALMMTRVPEYKCWASWASKSNYLMSGIFSRVNVEETCAAIIKYGRIKFNNASGVFIQGIMSVYQMRLGFNREAAHYIMGSSWLDSCSWSIPVINAANHNNVPNRERELLLSPSTQSEMEREATWQQPETRRNGNNKNAAQIKKKRRYNKCPEGKKY